MKENNKFKVLFKTNKNSFMPFFTLGDPDFESSFNLIKSAIDAGADCLELGIPFSDPIADGPTNQRSMERALRAGMNFESCLKLIRKIRDYAPSLPMGLLLYYNMIYHRGLEQSLKDLAVAGVDAIVCGDLPIEEGELFDQLCEKNKIAPVYIIAPNTPDLRALEIFKKSSDAYAYILSGLGVTGVKDQVAPETILRVQHLRKLDPSARMMVGFGISKPEQVKIIWEAGANGAIVGSYFSNLIEKNLGDLNKAQNLIKKFIEEL